MQQWQLKSRFAYDKTIERGQLCACLITQLWCLSQKDILGPPQSCWNVGLSWVFFAFLAERFSCIECPPCLVWCSGSYWQTCTVSCCDMDTPSLPAYSAGRNPTPTSQHRYNGYSFCSVDCINRLCFVRPLSIFPKGLLNSANLLWLHTENDDFKSLLSLRRWSLNFATELIKMMRRLSSSVNPVMPAELSSGLWLCLSGLVCQKPCETRRRQFLVGAWNQTAELFTEDLGVSFGLPPPEGTDKGIWHWLERWRRKAIITHYQGGVLSLISCQAKKTPAGKYQGFCTDHSAVNYMSLSVLFIATLLLSF